MTEARILVVFLVLLLATGLLAGYAAIDVEATCPVGHQDVRFGDVDREFLVAYPVAGSALPITDHAWVTVHENGSVAIGSVIGARQVFLHPENGTVGHGLQSLDGEWETDGGRVTLVADFRRDEARISIENGVYVRQIAGPVVKYCGPLG